MSGATTFEEVINRHTDDATRDARRKNEASKYSFTASKSVVHMGQSIVKDVHLFAKGCDVFVAGLDVGHKFTNLIRADWIVFHSRGLSTVNS